MHSWIRNSKEDPLGLIVSIFSIRKFLIVFNVCVTRFVFRNYNEFIENETQARFGKEIEYIVSFEKNHCC